MKRILQQLLFLLMVLSVFLIWPAYARTIIFILISMILIIAIFSIPRKHYASYKSAEISKSQYFGKILWDILKIILAIYTVSLLGQSASAYASSQAEVRWQGMGLLFGFITLIVVSLFTSNLFSWAMLKIDNILFKLPQLGKQ